MRRQSIIVSLGVACLLVSACHGLGSGGKAPSGQVVATVGGQEITVRDLQAEMANVTVTDPKARKAAEQAALRALVGRKMLAQTAQAQGLDKTPDFALLRQRATDLLLVQTLQAKIVRDVPAPTREEAEAFVAQHPNSFAERKIFTVDQLRFARPSDPTFLKRVEALTTLADFEALLTREHIVFSRASETLDALKVDPGMIESVAKLPPDEVFVIAANDTVLVNQVKQTQIVPFTGEPAVAFALQQLKRQHVQQALQRQLSAIIAKAATTVQYNPAYQPPRPAPAPTSKS